MEKKKEHIFKIHERERCWGINHIRRFERFSFGILKQTERECNEQIHTPIN